MVKEYLAFTYWIKNQFIDVAWGALHGLFWIFEYITTGPFAGPLNANFSDVEFNQQ